MDKILLKEKEINKFLGIASAFIYGLAGVCLILRQPYFIKFLFLALIGIFLYNSFKALVSLIFRKNAWAAVSSLLINLSAAAVVYFKPMVVGILFSWFMGLWSTFMGLAHFINAYQYNINKVKGAFINVLQGLASFIIGAYLLLKPMESAVYAGVYIGIYFVFYSLSLAADMIIQIIPVKAKNNIKRSIRLALPTMLAALIPQKVLSLINEALRQTPNEEDNHILNMSKSDKEVDLEIFVHISPGIIGQMGHVDIAFKDTVLSYGNYDDDSYYLGGIAGDGVIEVIDKIPYINFCIRHSKKMIVSFGVILDSEQKENAKAKIDGILKDIIPWEPKAKRNLGAIVVKSAKYAHDYASSLYEATGARFYKFSRGKYKSYFGFGTNCVRLSDDILKSLGIASVRVNGIVTPGAYYEHFNNEFKKQNSVVVSRRIYNKPVD